jgi:hypothetical protein
MRAKALVFYILLLTLELSLLSTVVQAIEYSEVNKDVQAADILNHIERGDDVNLTNCHIVGELNLSKIKFETVPDQRFGYYYKSDGVFEKLGNENLSVMKSSIIIKNSTFENRFRCKNNISAFRHYNFHLYVSFSF